VAPDPRCQEVEGNNVTGVLVVKQPWPGIARTVYGDHARYLATYMQFKEGYYFTGDGALRDGDGYYWVTGRVDGRPVGWRDGGLGWVTGRVDGRPLGWRDGWL
jgi:acyl-coenzyme A synthetase/AMP-(fatty) acid ligase